MEEFFLFSGGSTHQWEKSQRVLTFLTQNGSFFRKNFHDREPVENVRKKILADGKQVFFAVGDIDSSQDKWTFGPNHRKWLKNFCSNCQINVQFFVFLNDEVTWVII